MILLRLAVAVWIVSFIWNLDESSADDQCTTEGDSRLLGQGDEYNGNVEMCVNGTWGTICGDHWDDEDAEVFCRQLGHSTYDAFATVTLIESNISHFIDLNCTGNEEALMECPHGDQQECTLNAVAAVSCQDPEDTYSNCTNGSVRLTGGETEREGRLEICYNNIWGTVCVNRIFDFYYDYVFAYQNHYQNTEVVCRQLGLRPAYNFFLGGELSNGRPRPVLFQSLSCEGVERNVLDCQGSFAERGSNCNEEAIIRCEEICVNEDVRFQPGQSASTIISEINICVNGSWRSICQASWDEVDATVVCAELGYSRYGAFRGTSSLFFQGLPTFLNDVECVGNEDSIWDCPSSTRDCNSISYTAGAVCQDSSVEFSNCTNGEVRLIGGSSAIGSDGWLQVCYNNVWGGVCFVNTSYYNFIPFHNAMCEVLGFLPPLEIGEFTHPMQDSYNQTTLIELRSCLRGISNPLDCSWNPVGVNSFCSQERYFWLECRVLCDPPCVHGVCISTSNCSCSEGYTGEFCDVEVPTEEERNEVTIPIVMHTEHIAEENDEVTIPLVGALVGAVFILVILCAGALILFYCWKKVHNSETFKDKNDYQGDTIKQEDIKLKEPLVE